MLVGVDRVFCISLLLVIDEISELHLSTYMSLSTMKLCIRNLLGAIHSVVVDVRL